MCRVWWDLGLMILRTRRCMIGRIFTIPNRKDTTSRRNLKFAEGVLESAVGVLLECPSTVAIGESSVLSKTNPGRPIQREHWEQ